MSQPHCLQLRCPEALRERTLTPNYEHMLYMQYQHCMQGNRSINGYTEEFYRLSVRNNLNESENQLVARYVGGLKEAIQDKLELNTVWSLSQAVNYALKVEIQQSRHGRNSQSRRTAEPVSDMNRMSNFKSTSFNSQPPTHSVNSTPPMAPSKTIEVRANYKFKGPAKDDPYAKPSTIKYFRCFQQGHKSNECPTRGQLQLLEMENEEEMGGIREGRLTDLMQ
ncbi:hypothetical protein KFK09_010163 [Dendrobium nobile]|uniref:Retrotransposon gag domain-containing protein n=1 Tax=Dendrobium nobile TaxID=94219 RepID=A0A8T3BN48_DENNO|nr:hypothetical protein KFK09_010163 [Dendrobium nobile]